MPGLFVQNEWEINSSNRLLAGIRYDRNSIYGDIWTPRLNYKWSNKNKTSALRLGFGSGYRVVNIFTEEFCNFVDLLNYFGTLMCFHSY